jgi:hypothetical protein
MLCLSAPSMNLLISIQSEFLEPFYADPESLLGLDLSEQFAIDFVGSLLIWDLAGWALASKYISDRLKTNEWGQKMRLHAR